METEGRECVREKEDTDVGEKGDTGVGERERIQVWGRERERRTHIQERE